MKTHTDQTAPRVASTVHGEDIVCGDFVAVLQQTFELPSFLWDRFDTELSPHQPVRLRVIPCDGGEPLRVTAVCLPFVYVKTHRGRTEILDTRRMQLARLDRPCAKAVWRQLRSDSGRGGKRRR